MEHSGAAMVNASETLTAVMGVGIAVMHCDGGDETGCPYSTTTGSNSMRK